MKSFAQIPNFVHENIDTALPKTTLSIKISTMTEKTDEGRKDRKTGKTESKTTNETKRKKTDEFFPRFSIAVCDIVHGASATTSPSKSSLTLLLRLLYLWLAYSCIYG